METGNSVFVHIDRRDIVGFISNFIENTINCLIKPNYSHICIKHCNIIIQCPFIYITSSLPIKCKTPEFTYMLKDNKIVHA